MGASPPSSPSAGTTARAHAVQIELLRRATTARRFERARCPTARSSRSSRCRLAVTMAALAVLALGPQPKAASAQADITSQYGWFGGYLRTPAFGAGSLPSAGFVFGHGQVRGGSFVGGEFRFSIDHSAMISAVGVGHAFTLGFSALVE